ncbi:hypothetical protein L2E82_05805 [Cichorium intybus]|uniref:Uncharacterized protein n=1 Tax=Cichorium intybus TaxID=13427 RepID=A0ACB9H848_CICIN|nr:hypothetical protein L2E82_05805 [Cichorium intybus]
MIQSQGNLVSFLRSKEEIVTVHTIGCPNLFQAFDPFEAYSKNKLVKDAVKELHNLHPDVVPYKDFEEFINQIEELKSDKLKK